MRNPPGVEATFSQLWAQQGRNLTHGMLDVLGRTIVVGNYGHRLFATEAELAKRYGVSRAVTREAVKMLSAKGLLSTRARRGITVQPTASWNLFDPDVLRWLQERKVSFELLRHFYQLRMAVEPEAAALAAVWAGTGDRKLINSALERIEAAAGELESPQDVCIAFHAAILVASENPLFAQFQNLTATALRMAFRFTSRISGFCPDVDAYVAIRDAIMKKSADQARNAMRRTISGVLKLAEANSDAKPVKS